MGNVPEDENSEGKEMEIAGRCQMKTFYSRGKHYFLVTVTSQRRMGAGKEDNVNAVRGSSSLESMGTTTGIKR